MYQTLTIRLHPFGVQGQRPGAEVQEAAANLLARGTGARSPRTMKAKHSDVPTWYVGDALGSVRLTLDDASAPLSVVDYDLVTKEIHCDRWSFALRPPSFALHLRCFVLRPSPYLRSSNTSA